MNILDVLATVADILGCNVDELNPLLAAALFRAVRKYGVEVVMETIGAMNDARD